MCPNIEGSIGMNLSPLDEYLAVEELIEIQSHILKDVQQFYCTLYHSFPRNCVVIRFCDFATAYEIKK